MTRVTAAKLVRMTSEAKSPATKAAVRRAKSTIETSGANCFEASKRRKIVDLSISPGACISGEIRSFDEKPRYSYLELNLVLEAGQEAGGDAARLRRCPKYKNWVPRQPP
jgi:hypothetical protein